MQIFAREREALQAQLWRHGALVFRRVGIENAREFSQLAEAFAGARTMSYSGGDSPRTRVGGDVYTSTEVPHDVRIPLHNELSYVAQYPRHLFFHCVKPAADGGETTLADGRAVLASIDPAVRARFAAHGVRYTYSYPGKSAVVSLVNRIESVQKTWMQVFESDDRRTVEATCSRLGLTPTWDHGRLHASSVRPAVVRHPGTLEAVWFAQPHLFELSTRYLSLLRYVEARVASLHPDLKGHEARYGDGTRIEPQVLDHLHDVLDANSVDVKLEQGDFVAIDNVLCMHGRRAFSGPRRILVTMTH